MVNWILAFGLVIISSLIVQCVGEGLSRWIRRWVWGQARGSWRFYRIWNGNPGLTFRQWILVCFGGGFFVLAVGFWVTGSPVCGLFCSLVYFAAIPLGLRYAQNLRWQQISGEALSFFVALKGLIHVGYSLPSALFTLASLPQNRFARVLKPFLSQFSEGRGISQCMHAFIRLLPSESFRCWIRVLMRSYQDHLELGPVLNQMLVLLEQERRMRGRLSQLRAQAFGQVALVAMLPWALLVILGVFEPNMVAIFFADYRGWAVILASLLFEMVGAIILWRVSVFV